MSITTQSIATVDADKLFSVSYNSKKTLEPFSHTLNRSKNPLTLKEGLKDNLEQLTQMIFMNFFLSTIPTDLDSYKWKAFITKVKKTFRKKYEQTAEYTYFLKLHIVYTKKLGLDP